MTIFEILQGLADGQYIGETLKDKEGNAFTIVSPDRIVIRFFDGFDGTEESWVKAPVTSQVENPLFAEPAE